MKTSAKGLEKFINKLLFIVFFLKYDWHNIQRKITGTAKSDNKKNQWLDLIERF